MNPSQLDSILYKIVCALLITIVNISRTNLLIIRTTYIINIPTFAIKFIVCEWRKRRNRAAFNRWVYHRFFHVFLCLCLLFPKTNCVGFGFPHPHWCVVVISGRLFSLSAACRAAVRSKKVNTLKFSIKKTIFTLAILLRIIKCDEHHRHHQPNAHRMRTEWLIPFGNDELKVAVKRFRPPCHNATNRNLINHKKNCQRAHRSNHIQRSSHNIVFIDFGWLRCALSWRAIIYINYSMFTVP